MDIELKERFLNLWKKYFDEADLPIVFYYTDQEDRGEIPKTPKGFRCIISDLARVLKGEARCFDVNNLGCKGVKENLGFDLEVDPNFKYILSTGIPGKIPGGRYKKSPDLAKELHKYSPLYKAPAKYVVFKRWDLIDEKDEPQVVIFFAPIKVLLGLFSLANFDEADPQAVITPFTSGCGSIIAFPYKELQSESPRAVMGMFDLFPRPLVSPEVLTFAVPWPKFVRMVENMEESFLTTDHWEKVRSRENKKA